MGPMIPQTQVSDIDKFYINKYVKMLLSNTTLPLLLIHNNILTMYLCLRLWPSDGRANK